MILMSDLDLAGKRVLIREDLNVPIKDGKVTSEARIDAAVPTLLQAREAGAAVIVLSHLGRPSEGSSAATQPEYSLAPVARSLSRKLGVDVPLVTDWEQGLELSPGDVVLLENIRFQKGEKADDDGLARKLAGLCDIFVMDAFGTAHRAQASTHGVAKFAPVACAGPLLTRELEALGKALKAPQHPFVAVVGGSKVSTKLAVLEKLAELADCLIPGGGIANTFIAAAGIEVGRSLYEPELMETARRIAARTEVPLPVDVMTATTLKESEPALLRPVDGVAPDEMILDIGPETARRFSGKLMQANTIIWNGPVGVFEYDQFGEGTRVLAEAIATSQAYSLAGGGDTLAAIDKYGVASGISYISTGGGAFLEFVEGKTLPAVAILEQRAAS